MLHMQCHERSNVTGRQGRPLFTSLKGNGLIKEEKGNCLLQKEKDTNALEKLEDERRTQEVQNTIASLQSILFILSQKKNTAYTIDSKCSIYTFRNRRASDYRRLHQWDKVRAYFELKIKNRRMRNLICRAFLPVTHSLSLPCIAGERTDLYG